MLSIMSHHTMDDMRRRLERARETTTTVNVLTLDPELDLATVEALRIHLDEKHNKNAAAVADQIKGAFDNWSSFVDEFPLLHVGKYRSIPTLQGVLVKGEYMTIELLPFATSTTRRPGIYLTRAADHELFDLFEGSFLAMWGLWEKQRMSAISTGASTLTAEATKPRRR